NGVERKLARVQIEDELPLGESSHVPEQRLPVPPVVDRAEAGHRRHGTGRDELVQIRVDDLRPIAEAPTRCLDHRLARVDAEVLEPSRQQVLPEAAVAAREVADAIAGPEPRAELDDEARAMLEVGVGVRGLALGPACRLRVVLRAQGTVTYFSARSRSGCLRTNRRTLCQCHSVRRIQKRSSVSASQRWRTIAPGTY